jgi:hypothetical protein
MAENEINKTPALDVLDDKLLVGGRVLSEIDDGYTWLDRDRNIQFFVASDFESCKRALSQIISRDSPAPALALLLKDTALASVEQLKQAVADYVGDKALVAITASENSRKNAPSSFSNFASPNGLSAQGFYWEEKQELCGEDSKQIEAIWRSHAAKVFSDIWSQRITQELVERNIELIVNCKAQLVLKQADRIVGHFPRHDGRPSGLRWNTAISVIDLWLNHDVLTKELRKEVHSKAFEFFRSSGLFLEATTNPKAKRVISFLMRNGFTFHRIMVRRLPGE